jgi:hypothetical protein
MKKKSSIPHLLPYKQIGFWPFVCAVEDGWEDLGVIEQWWVTTEDGQVKGCVRICGTCRRRMRIGRVTKTNELMHYCAVCLIPCKPDRL